MSNFKFQGRPIPVGAFPDVSVERRRLWRVMQRTVTADSNKPRNFLLCERRMSEKETLLPNGAQFLLFWRSSVTFSASSFCFSSAHREDHESFGDNGCVATRGHFLLWLPNFRSTLWDLTVVGPPLEGDLKVTVYSLPNSLKNALPLRITGQNISVSQKEICSSGEMVLDALSGCEPIEPDSTYTSQRKMRKASNIQLLQQRQNISIFTWC